MHYCPYTLTSSSDLEILRSWDLDILKSWNRGGFNGCSLSSCLPATTWRMGDDTRPMEHLRVRGWGLWHSYSYEIESLWHWPPCCLTLTLTLNLTLESNPFPSDLHGLTSLHLLLSQQVSDGIQAYLEKSRVPRYIITSSSSLEILKSWNLEILKSWNLEILRSWNHRESTRVFQVQRRFIREPMRAEI